MNAINNALSDLKYSIPEEILQLAFREQNLNYNTLISTDNKIVSRVIQPKVMKDCNLVSGQQIWVDLNKCGISRVGSEYYIDVPKELTNHRSIVSALSIHSYAYYSSNTTSGSVIMELGNKLLNTTIGNEDTYSTSRLEVVAENIVLVQDPSSIITSGIMKCVIENDSQMNNLNVRAFPNFSRLVELAVKAYIHNHMTIKLGKGYIYNGHELGIVKDTIDGYADALEMYNDFLRNKWIKTNFMSDSSRMTSVVANML